MRRDPVAGVVWITFDKKFAKKGTQVPNDSFWMDLPRFSEIKSFSDDIDIEYSPSNIRYWSFCSIAYMTFIVISCITSVLFFAAPKPKATSAPKKPSSPGNSQPVIVINSTPKIQPSAPVQSISVPSSPVTTNTPQEPKRSGTAGSVSPVSKKSGGFDQPTTVDLPQTVSSKTTQPVSLNSGNTKPANKSSKEKQINSSPIIIDLSTQNTPKPVRQSSPTKRTKRKIQIIN